MKANKDEETSKVMKDITDENTETVDANPETILAS